MENKKKINSTISIVSMLIILGIIVLCIRLGLSAQMAILLAAVAAVLIAFACKTKWQDIQKDFEINLGNCINPIMIILLIGALIGMWLVGGGIQSLIYYGLKFVSPSAIVPLTFVLCSLTSIFTGTSFGSVATMGLAMYSVAINMGVPAGLIVGAIVSGSFLGDKMSPLSDTTNLAPAMAGTDLYSHIGSMFYTTIPAAVITLLLYIILGIRYGDGTYDANTINLIMDTLEENYNIGVLCLVPLILLLILSAARMPAILAMLIIVVISAVMAMGIQDVTFSQVFDSAMNGFVSSTGVEMVDGILTRGGIVSMISSITSMSFASLMAAGLKASGILDAIIVLLMKCIRSAKALIITTLGYCYAMVLATGAQMVGIIVPGETMGELYDEYDLDRKVLSRTLEDAATIGSALIPWALPSVYTMTVLDTDTSYIPYAFLCYIVPVFSVICAFTGFGIWNKKGQPVWKKGNKNNELSNSGTNESKAQ